MIVYMYSGAWLFTTNRSRWSNASEGTLSGPVARQQESVNLTYSTSVLTRRGQDFATFNATRPLVTC